MARGQIFEDIYAFLVADAALLAILGPVSDTNQRILRSYPQLQALLTDYEPANEGWLVIDEPDPFVHQEQLDTIYEIIEPAISVFATRFSLSDDVIDRLDTFLNWSIEQQRALSFGERLVLMTRRMLVKDSYDTEIKLYRKDVRFRMTLVLEEQPV